MARQNISQGGGGGGGGCSGGNEALSRSILKVMAGNLPPIYSLLSHVNVVNICMSTFLGCLLEFKGDAALMWELYSHTVHF